MLKRGIFLVTLFLISSTILWAFNDAKELRSYNGMLVSSVVFSTSSVDTLPIQNQMLTKPGKKFSAALAQSDIDRIYSIGDFSDVHLRFTKNAKSELTVVVDLLTNPVVKKIKLEGNTVYTNQEIVEQLKTKVGVALNINTMREDITFIEKNLYDEKGYILAKIQEVNKPTATNNYTFTVHIQEGVIDTVELEGNDQTRAYVILRELELASGKVFNRDVLISDLRRIYNTNYFGNVEPNYIPSPRDPSKIILIIKVEEKSTNTLNFGGGWGALQGGFAFVDMQMGNLFGTGQLLSAKAQLGDTSTYQLKYHNPWMWEDKTSLTSRYWLTTGRPVGIEGVESVGTSERRYGFDLSVGKTLLKNIVGRVTFLNEDVSPSSNENYNIRSLGFSLAYDTRDIWMDPSSGVYYQVGLQEAGRFLNGTLSYTRWQAQANHFYKLGEQQTLAARTAWSRQNGEVKSTEEFWMGGPNTVRGFSAGEYFSRGREKLLFNVEYRHRFNEMIQGVLFYDIGNAWDTVVAFVNSEKYRSSHGFGVRVVTPLGPIRLDYGIADNKELGQGVIHFSIGHVF